MSRRSSSYGPTTRSSQIQHSSTTSPVTMASPPLATCAADDSDTPSPPSSAKPGKTQSSRSREDSWSEDSTYMLIEAWGDHHKALKGGNLRRNNWQEVADEVNSVHGHTNKLRRSAYQCQNRMDTVKKKYKVEKSRVRKSSGAYTSRWPYFARLDSLIGRRVSPKPKPKPKPKPSPSRIIITDSSETDSERGGKEEECTTRVVLAEAIEMIGELYERVEREKLRQVVDLEKQKMRFAKDLEIEWIRVMTESQVQLESIAKAYDQGL